MWSAIQKKTVIAVNTVISYTDAQLFTDEALAWGTGKAWVFAHAELTVVFFYSLLHMSKYSRFPHAPGKHPVFAYA